MITQEKKKCLTLQKERNWVCKCKVKTNKEEKPEPPTFLEEAILKIEATMISECCSTAGDLNFQGWTKVPDSAPVSSAVAAALHLGQEELAQALMYQPPLLCHPEPSNSNRNGAIQVFAPKHPRQEEHSGLSWLPAPLWQWRGSCPRWEEAQRVPCSQGGDSKERTFTSIFLLLQNSQN